MTYSTDSAQTAALLERVAAGDTAALENLLDLHRDFLLRLVKMRIESGLRTRVDASDVVQETMIVIYRRIEDFVQNRPTSFRIWLRRKVLEQLIDERRRHVHAKKRSIYAEREMPDASGIAIAGALLPETPTPSRILGKAEEQERIQQLIDELSENDREILTMRHAEGLTNTEVADVLNIDPATARKRHGRALRRLRQRVVEQNNSLNETQEP